MKLTVQYIYLLAVGTGSPSPGRTVANVVRARGDPLEALGGRIRPTGGGRVQENAPTECRVNGAAWPSSEGWRKEVEPARDAREPT